MSLRAFPSLVNRAVKLMEPTLPSVSLATSDVSYLSTVKFKSSKASSYKSSPANTIARLYFPGSILLKSNSACPDSFVVPFNMRPSDTSTDTVLFAIGSFLSSLRLTVNNSSSNLLFNLAPILFTFILTN